MAWALLPLATAFTAAAPARSFAASQAGFTVALLLLFDIISPAGWATGIVRVKDMALGCAVAAAAGVLFWPHGASATLRRELAAGLHSSVTYLRATLDYALSLCDSATGATPRPDGDRARADDAARRLDDAFRQFSTERGVKPGAAGPVSGLAVTAAYLRSTGDAVYDVWRDQDACPGSGRKPGSPCCKPRTQ